MTRIGPGFDWGQRSTRWAGVNSEVVDIGGTRVHYLRAGAEASGPTHLLIHPMGSGAWSWMDVIGPLSASGSEPADLCVRVDLGEGYGGGKRPTLVAAFVSTTAARWRALSAHYRGILLLGRATPGDLLGN
jgi:hypothetical protein